MVKMIEVPSSGRPKRDCGHLRSIYVMRDRVILKFEARVHIYVALLNFGCEIQNSGRNIVRFTKINRYEISFWLLLFKGALSRIFPL